MPNPPPADAHREEIEQTLHTPLCALLGCRLPLVLAGMGGVARSELVAAVGEAGGFGFLGMVREPVALIRNEVAAVRRLTARPFGVNLIPAATDPALLRDQIDACVALRVPVVGLFWDVSPNVIARLREAGIRVVHQVGSVADADLAQESGADALIVQGIEAGGHVRGLRPLTELLAEVLAVAHVPVAAAGGIADGVDVARVLSLGAQAAVLGTALAATTDSFAHDFHKQRLVDARGSDTLLTEIFHINWPPRCLVRVLPNSATRGERGDAFGEGRTVIGDEQGRPIYLFSTDSPLRSMTGDFEAMALYAGAGVGRVDAVVPAAERIARLAAEAAVQLRLASGRAGRASAVCYAEEPEARQAPDAAARRGEILARLDELLEAERAGARVTLRSVRHTDDVPLRAAIEAIHHDEVRWCAMLSRLIRGLQATPSTRTGAFYDKAMAVEDLRERMDFLNRGQGWVVKKLRELLALIPEGEQAMRRDLDEMLVAHRTNIERVKGLLGESGNGAPASAPHAALSPQAGRRK
ncbi:MAG: 2-nitropropane dioxygenase [Panacagrimonas sp.]|nr:nitronate monooxygenase [Panacagrimonas sp.]MCC2656300.1 2-nitropropane dioxygenase [Panacagrimonas sp.]